MRTRPVQAWGGGGEAESEKKIRGRQAGGLGSEAMHVCTTRRERKLQANVCGCVCARVCYRSVRFFV